MRRDQPHTHHIKLDNEFVEYYLTDLNKQLKDQEITVYLTYEHMTIVGPTYGEKIKIGTFKAPSNYISGSRRDYHPGPKNREFNY